MTTPAKLAGWASRWLTSELQALASVGSWEAAIQTFTQMSDMTREEPLPGAQSFSSSVSSSSTSSSSVSSSSMSSTTTTNPVLAQQQQQARVFHYTTIISACGKAGQWEAALQAFTHMNKSRVEPNVRTYTALLHACTRGENLDLALRAWAMMEADGIVANCFATTALVSAFARAAKWEDAIRTTLDAEKNPFPHQEPNVFTYTAAMDACRRAGKAGPAVQLLRRMAERGVRGNTVSYTTALNACAAGRDWQCALEVLQRQRAEKVRLIPFGRACALQALSDAPEDIASEQSLEKLLGPERKSVPSSYRQRSPFADDESVAGNSGANYGVQEGETGTPQARVVASDDNNNEIADGPEATLPSDVQDLLQDPPPAK